MLRARIVTAIFLFAAFFCALYYFPPAGWLGFTALVAILAFWEWGGLMKLPVSGRYVMAAGSLAAIIVMTLFFPGALGLAEGGVDNLWFLGRWLYLPATAFWLFVAPFWLRRRWSVSHPLVGSVVGALVILPAWLALVQLRQLGAGQLLAIMGIVWLADIAAYFSGRALGRHKLAPGISPGKTWEGVVGGVLAVIVYGFMFAFRLPATLSGNKLLLLGGLVLVTMVSVVGDLFESLLKRQVGLKDSSNLLPGHGGILDRIDSLTSTLPLVALFWFGTSV